MTSFFENALELTQALSLKIQQVRGCWPRKLSHSGMGNCEEASNKAVRNRERQCRRLNAIASRADLSGKYRNREVRPVKRVEPQDRTA